jgi:hypothetical protein
MGTPTLDAVPAGQLQVLRREEVRAEDRDVVGTQRRGQNPRQRQHGAGVADELARPAMKLVLATFSRGLNGGGRDRSWRKKFVSTCNGVLISFESASEMDEG